MHLIENARQLLRDDRHEDSLTELIESQTELIPSAAFLGFALGAMALSWLFLATGRRNVAHFIGPVGADHPDHGALQQDGQAARQGLAPRGQRRDGREDRSAQRHRRDDVGQSRDRELRRGRPGDVLVLPCLPERARVDPAAHNGRSAQIAANSPRQIAQNRKYR